MQPKPGWNATRRNRNIGTPKAGHGQKNCLVIPSRWGDGPSWAQIRSYRTVRRDVHGRPLHFVVQRPRRGFLHPCTVDDVVTVLSALPKEVLEAPEGYGLAGVILRQPSRKQVILDRCWGRLAWHLELGPVQGPAIYLDAQPVPLRLRRSLRLDVEQEAELGRLREEADEVHSDKRAHHLTFGLEGLRRVLLYRTLLHELGHLVDFWDRVVRPELLGGDLLELHDAYDSQPEREREEVAHRFAERWSATLRERGCIPFPRLVDCAAMEADGLDPAAFLPPKAPPETT
ncbi:hypothetical protein [Polyangium sp. 6x1]|uniref:hypothetical protein n=1 Tax=Polyangium sp. 6x1 TaxID=3042689 RepID=UPI0024823770|nr:hypothetical protein [Polyangium sp. 6x1]MDI1450919.1 hypothetical protein [Polyangium sp. 6x1]